MPSKRDRKYIRTKQPLPSREELVRALIALAHQQLAIEAEEIALQSNIESEHRTSSADIAINESTTFVALGLVDLAWCEFADDILSQWIVDENRVPKEPDEYLSFDILSSNILKQEGYLSTLGQSIADEKPPKSAKTGGRIYPPVHRKKKLR
jgi:hypothetical protein